MDERDVEEIGWAPPVPGSEFSKTEKLVMSVISAVVIVVLICGCCIGFLGRGIVA